MTSDTPSRGFRGSLIEDTDDKERIAGATHDRLAEDASSLREDVTKMHETVSNFVLEMSGHAARTASSVGQAVASQVGSTASGLANNGAEMASSATEQFNTFATELESIARKKPAWGSRCRARCRSCDRPDRARPWLMLRGIASSESGPQP
jgi:hypothetical protein